MSVTSVTIDPRARFLRVVRTLTLLSGVMTPVTLGALGLAGCGGSDATDPTIQGGGIRAYDGGEDTTDALAADTGRDAFDGIDAGISIGDTNTDAADAADTTDAEIGIGGPLIAPEMPEELIA